MHYMRLKSTLMWSFVSTKFFGCGSPRSLRFPVGSKFEAWRYMGTQGHTCPGKSLDQQMLEAYNSSTTGSLRCFCYFNAFLSEVETTNTGTVYHIQEDGSKVCIEVHPIVHHSSPFRPCEPARWSPAHGGQMEPTENLFASGQESQHSCTFSQYHRFQFDVVPSPKWGWRRMGWCVCRFLQEMRLLKGKDDASDVQRLLPISWLIPSWFLLLNYLIHSVAFAVVAVVASKSGPKLASETLRRLHSSRGKLVQRSGGGLPRLAIATYWKDLRCKSVIGCSLVLFLHYASWVSIISKLAGAIFTFEDIMYLSRRRSSELKQGKMEWQVEKLPKSSYPFDGINKHAEKVGTVNLMSRDRGIPGLDTGTLPRLAWCRIMVYRLSRVKKMYKIHQDLYQEWLRSSHSWIGRELRRRNFAGP